MLLLKNKCDLNVTNKDGDTPLIVAARTNEIQIVSDGYYYPERVVSKHDRTDMMLLLIENKCDANVADAGGDAPLILAARNNYLTIARELVWSLCDLKIRNKTSKTPAEVAKEKGHDALAEYLASQAPREQVPLPSLACATP